VEDKQLVPKDKCSMCESMDVDSQSRYRQGYVSSYSNALHEGVCGRGDIAPLIIHLGARCDEWLGYRPGRFIPGERSTVSDTQEAGWTSESLWRL